MINDKYLSLISHRSSFSFLIFLLIALLPLPAQTTETKAPAKTLGLEEVLKGFRALGETEFRWDPLLRSGTIVAGGCKTAFAAAGGPGGTGPVLINGREVLTLPQPFLEGGLLRFPESFVITTMDAVRRRLEEEASRLRIGAIIVDAGHGGKDSGAEGNFMIKGKPFKSVEKDITLKTAKFLYDRLKEVYGDKRIILTRSSDVYLTLEDRVAIANAELTRDNEAVIFLSIHANAHFDKAARGYEAWYLSPDYRRNVIDQSKYEDTKEVIPIINAMMEEELTTESILMAQSILKRLGEAAGDRLPSRGLKAEEWFVVRNSRMPAVLVELGFVTNEKDALLMDDETYLKNIAESLYKGLSDFIVLFERSRGFTARE